MINKYASILDYSFPGIPVDIWSSDGTLLPYIKDFILKLLNSCYGNYQLKNPEAWAKDVTIIGSTTTTRYTRSSDVDIHIIVDINEFIKTNMPKASKEEAFEKLDTTRKEFDRAKILLPMTERVAEYFFEVPEMNKTNTDNCGRYSLLQDKWLKEPIFFKQDDDFTKSHTKAIEEAKKIAGELDVTFGEIGRQIQTVDELRDVLRAWPTDKQQLYYKKIQEKLDEIEKDIEKSIQIKENIVNERHDQHDLLSTTEAKFKYLTRFFYFSIINELKAILDDKDLSVEDLPLIEKVISEASLEIKSVNRAAASWIDPNGKAYYLDDENIPTHMEWILAHIELLRDEYGYSDIETYLGETEGSHNDLDHIDGYLNSKGWSRIGDTGQSEFGIEVSDISDIPQGLITYLISMPWDGKLNFYVEDTSGSYVQVNLGELRTEGQKAVNRALSHKRLQHASLNKQARNLGYAYWVDPVGKIYTVRPNEYSKDLFTHSDWVVANQELLKEQYGLNLDVNCFKIIKEMYDAGWARIGDSGRSDMGYGITVGSLSHIPEGVDIALAQFYKGEELIVDGEFDHETVLINDPFPSLQKAVNKALSQKRLQPTSSLKQAFLKEAFTSEEDFQEAMHCIYVDFDDTICKENPDHTIGEPLPGAKEGLLKLKELGYNIVLDSHRCNTEEGCKEVMDAMQKYDLPYDEIYEGQKPLAFRYIDDRAVQFKNWEDAVQQVEKAQKKTASLHIVSGDRAQAAYWVDPNGKVYPVKTTHEDWFFENEQLLRNQYGYSKDEIGQDWWDIKTGNLLNQLLEDGWLRVGDLFAAGRKYIGTGIEIANLNSIPSTLIDFISNWGRDKYFQIEDLQRRFVELSVEELMADGQEAVNRALQQEKMLSRRGSLSQKYWIDPQGRAFALDRKESHPSWIMENLSELNRNYNIDVSSKYTQKIANEMFQQGWVRVTSGQETSDSSDFAIEVADITNIPAYIDNFIASKYTGNGVEVSDLKNEYVKVDDPFPYIQDQVNKSLRQPVMSKVFSKKEIKARTSTSAWLMDPQGKLYPAIGDDHETTALKLTGKSMYDLLPLGWVTIRTVGSGYVSISVNKFNQIPSTVDDYLASHSFKEISIISADPNLEGLPEPPHVSYQTAIEYGIQKAINRDIMQMKNMPTVNKQAEIKSDYDFSSTQLNLPKEISEKIIRWAIDNIPEDELFNDLNDAQTKGIQLESHITLKYGLLTDNKDEIEQALKGEKAPKIKFGKTSFFEPEGKDYDVVIIEVESVDLQKLNKKLCDSVKHEDTTGSEYHPHATIAYVKRGSGKKYSDKDILNGEEITLNQVIFSPKMGDKSTIELGNKKEASGNNFFPSLFQAPNNEQQFQDGGPDQEICLNPDSVDDDTTLYGEWWQDKPRNPECWRAFISMFKQPLSKKENMTVEAGESEEWDSHYGDIWHVGDKVKDKITGKIGIIKSINGKEVELEEVENA